MDFSVVDQIVELVKSLTKPLGKESTIKAIVDQLKLRKEKTIYCSEHLTIRFSYSTTEIGFSNMFLAFKKIIKYDYKPLIACIIKGKDIEFLLANTTFISWISHSSKKLTLNRIKGSANLSNIIEVFSNLKNEPVNFPALYELHMKVSQSDNIERIVEATQRIVGRIKKFELSDEQKIKVYEAPKFIKDLENNEMFVELRNKLLEKVTKLQDEILKISKTDNVNLRGNEIEQLVTEGKNAHDLGDILEVINGDEKIIIDVKSKLLNLSSAPKAYNIDKLLKELSRGKTYFGYLFIGVDDKTNKVKVRLVSFIDKMLIENTRIQHHWSGQNSRGTAQLNDNIEEVFSENFNSKIDSDQAQKFLKKLIEL